LVVKKYDKILKMVSFDGEIFYDDHFYKIDDNYYRKQKLDIDFS
jgi:hypothetical protein